MRVVIAPNSFKDCLGAREVAEALARGIRSACPDVEIVTIPLSDGGDGLISVLAKTLGGERIETDTTDALGRPIKTEWLNTGREAVIEMALASGVARLKGPEEYDPLRTSTYGTGILLKTAMDAGCSRLIIGLGGSATVDAGCGMAQALGFRLENEKGEPIPQGGGGLTRLARIRKPVEGDSFPEDIETIGLVDVVNPLLGPSGAAAVFAPQKGASPKDVAVLEQGLARWAATAERDLSARVSALPGGGAAGGMGAGCAAFLGARLEPGAAWIARQSGLTEEVRRANVVLTGEGKIDSQTGFGKVPAHVSRIAAEFNKPVIAFGGSVAPGTDPALLGFRLCVRVSPDGMALDEAIRTAPDNLEKSASRTFKKIEEIIADSAG